MLLLKDSVLLRDAVISTHWLELRLVALIEILKFRPLGDNTYAAVGGLGDVVVKLVWPLVVVMELDRLETPTPETTITKAST